jgi:hypothetical protein
MYEGRLCFNSAESASISVTQPDSVTIQLTNKAEVAKILEADDGSGLNHLFQIPVATDPSHPRVGSFHTTLWTRGLYWVYRFQIFVMNTGLPLYLI